MKKVVGYFYTLEDNGDICAKAIRSEVDAIGDLRKCKRSAKLFERCGWKKIKFFKVVIEKLK